MYLLGGFFQKQAHGIFGEFEDHQEAIIFSCTTGLAEDVYIVSDCKILRLSAVKGAKIRLPAYTNASP